MTDVNVEVTLDVETSMKGDKATIMLTLIGDPVILEDKLVDNLSAQVKGIMERAFDDGTIQGGSITLRVTDTILEATP